jgi:mRNA interferase RelE/StbE
LAWTIEVDPGALKDLAKHDRGAQRRILRFLEERVAPEDPRLLGYPLHGDSRPLWRYRVGDYRILCRIEDARLVVAVVTIGHRREVYR